MPTLGGPFTTRSGLVFHSRTQGYYLRAYDQLDGDQLWKAPLPIGSQATPMSYVSPKTGKQYVVVTAGDTRQSLDRGDYINTSLSPINLINEYRRQAVSGLPPPPSNWLSPLPLSVAWGRHLVQKIDIG
jgi:hypothetical protein